MVRRKRGGGATHGSAIEGAEVDGAVIEGAETDGGAIAGADADGGATNDGAWTVRSPPGQWRLFGPALLAWAVVASAIVAPGTGHWIALGAALAGGALLLVAFIGRVSARARRGARLGRSLLRYGAVSCAVLVLLGARIELEESARLGEELVLAAEQGADMTLRATLIGYPETTETTFGSRGWVRAEIDTPRGGVPVLLWFEGEAERRWGPSMRIGVRGTLERFEAGSAAAYGVTVREFTDPFPSESESESASAAPAESVSASTQAQSTPQTRLAAISGGIAAELRQRLRAAADQIPGAELVPGFAVGDTSLVSDELEEQMLASSLTHLTAVSGSNISLICGAVIWCAARLGAGRRLRPAIAAAVLGGFVTVVGPDASVQRAAVMATVILVSGFGGKRAVSLPSLGIAMLVLLVADPWQALQPGFALSVAATAGILLLVPSLDRGLRRLVRAPGLPRAPQVLTLPISVAIAAQLACGPILLLLQPGIPAAGVLANVLAAPAAPLGTGIGLIGMVLLPLAPPAGEWAVALASLPARWVAATAEVTAALPLARWHWPEGWAGAILLAACEVAALLAWAVLSGRIALPGGPRTPRREPWRRAIEHPRRHRAAVAVLTGISAGTFVSISTAAPLVERIGTPANWSVVACDVGQGDALLLRDPGRPAETMLVDTGDDPELLIGCLERFGVRIISLLVLTHDDRDHVGALSAVVDRVEAALIAPPSAEDGPHRSVVRQLETAGVPTDIGVAGVHGEFGDGPSGGWNDGPSDRDHSDGAADPGRRGLVWEVLAPKRGVVPADSNSASVVLRVRADGVTTLLLADTGRDEHVSLLASGSDLSADVVKVAHHGSRDQDPAILVASGAEYGLISAGRDNGYGHPHPDVLSHLAAAGITALRTDLHGSLALSGPPGRIRAWVEHGGAGESGRAQR